MTVFHLRPAPHLPGRHQLFSAVAGAVSRTASRTRLALVLAGTAGLMACGGGDPALVPATTTVSGSVVKGPVNGAQVCAYTVAGSNRGAALGSCDTTDANGAYSLSLPVVSGAVWLEATGGSYTDEATNALTSLPAGVPLTSLVQASGASLSAMLTPLTTLALNNARSTVGAGGTLDLTAFETAAAQVRTAFSLPAGLDFSSTLPVFGTQGNDYATALTNISRMVAAGQSLTQILSTEQVSTLQAAYASAAAGGGSGGTLPPTPGGSSSASGSVAVSGAASFTPQADGFDIEVESAKTTYRFYRKTAQQNATILETIQVNVPQVGDPSVTHGSSFCFSNCRVSVTSPAGATHPVTVTFDNTPLSGGRTLTGSLTGDATGVLWSAAELPRTTDGVVAVNGSDVVVRTATDSTSVSTSTLGTTTVRTIVLKMADSSQISISQRNSGSPTVTRVKVPAALQFCSANCGITLTDSAAGTAVRFSGTTLDGGMTLANTVFIGKTQGSLTSPQLGSFTPVSDSISASNDLRTLSFSALDTAAGISSVTVEHRAGRVTTVNVSTGNGATAHNCFEAPLLGRPACAGITLGANGRDVSFDNVSLAGGGIGAPVSTITLSGALKAKGE